MLKLKIHYYLIIMVKNIQIESIKNLKFLLLSGQKINESIAWRGPFVMNTWDEIKQAYDDYFRGKLATVKGKSAIY